MNKLFSAAAAIALGLAAATSAQAASPGVHLGFRAGYSLPAGDATGSAHDNLSRSVGAAIPLQFDATWEFAGKPIEAGIYASYGFGSKGSEMQNATGTISLMSFGAQLNFLPPSDGTTRHWFGLLIGRESMSYTVTKSSTTLTSAITGWQGGLQGGTEWAVADKFSIGPWVSATIGQYSNISISDGDVTISGDPKNTALHQWISVGLRGSFGL